MSHLRFAAQLNEHYGPIVALDHLLHQSPFRDWWFALRIRDLAEQRLQLFDAALEPPAMWTKP